MRAPSFLALVVVLALSGCMNLNTDGLVFACEGPSCGGGAGGNGGSGGAGGANACQCEARATECRGNTLVSFARPTCRDSGVCQFQEVETPCPGACTNGQCEGLTCFGVTCDVPPRMACLSPTVLRGYTATGTCTGGTCSYGAVEVSCTCANDRCLSNPCAGVNCTTGPATTCVGSAVRTWAAAGVCDGSNGQCVYQSTDTACASGCANGQCNGDKCAGVTCSNPPAAFCTSASTVRQFATSGACNPATGACSYSSTDSACPSGVCSNGACQPVTTACNATNCAGGCCAGDTCVPYAQQGSGTCGTGGGSCVTCATGQTCGATGTCLGCTPESDASLCARNSRVCGPFTGTDNCGISRSVTCGTCPGLQTCSATGTCLACVAETDTAFCGRVGKTCGAVSGTDNCGAARSVASCGTCSGVQTCGSNNICACVPESNITFCSRLGKTCGQYTAADNCGVSRTVASCGLCTAPQTCQGSNVCSCVPETNAAFCTRLGKNCGQVSGADNCGTSRTVSSCGTCSGNEFCGGSGTAGVCGVTRMVFTSTFQTVPNTGSSTIEFRCTGTISLNGTRCSTTGQDPVQLRINGSTYVLYPGCDGNRNNCVTTVPSTGIFYDDNDAAGGRMLCDAMGWSSNATLTDKNAGLTDRAVAVFQTNPTIYGTDPALRNYISYVECRQ